MIIRDLSDLPKALEVLNSSLYLTFDVETTGLNVRSDQIIGFGCTNPFNLNQSFYIILKEWKDNELVEVIDKKHAIELINTLKKRKLITHNGSYDTRITYHYFGVDLIESIYHDTMLSEHTLNENRMDYKLKSIAVEKFGASVISEQADMLESIKANGGTEKEYYKADSSLMAKYGLQDNILTARLFSLNDKQLREQGLTKFFYEDEVMPLYTNVTIYMELKGIPVNVELMQETLTNIKVDLDRLHKSIQAQIAPELSDFMAWFINKEYPVKLSGEFFNTVATLIAPEDWPRTKTNSYSFSEAAFKKKQHLLTHDLYLYNAGKRRLPKELIEHTQAKMFKESGVEYAFNILSKDHLKRLLFERLKENPLSFTDKGNPQVTDELLDLLASKYNWVAELRIYNKLIKIKSTYIERFLDKQENGIFYPSFFMHRTDSGRFSGDMQQLNRPYEQAQLDSGEVDQRVFKYNNRIREFFISGEGQTFIDLDYDSQEVKVFAHVSEDEKIKDIFKQGLDFYSQICITTEGLKEYSADKKALNYLGKKNKAARQRAKSYALGLAFNMSPYALSKDLGISESEAKTIHRNYFENFPQLKQWVESSKKFAIENGYIKTQAGRIRRLNYLKQNVGKYGHILFDSLELWKKYNESVKEYEYVKKVSKECRSLLNVSVNFQVQSLAASITNRSAVACAKKYKELKLNARICAIQHDEILVISPDNEVEQATSILENCMMNTYKISLPLPAPPSTGKTYRESKG